MYDVGDDATATLTVTPYDDTTEAVAVATSPSGDEVSGGATTTDGGHTWTATLPLTEPGEWRLRWEVTGTGGGVQYDRIYAFTPASAEPAYATPSDLAAWLRAEPPATVDVLLPAAKRRLDWALIGAYYPVDDDGLPTDAAIAAALRDASCAQVAWWDEQGDTTGQGTGGDWADVSIGKLRLSRTATSSGSASSQTRQPQLAPEAARILQTAGLYPINGVWVWG